MAVSHHNLFTSFAYATITALPGFCITLSTALTAFPPEPINLFHIAARLIL